MKRVHFAAALVVLLGAVGCFDYDEEVWLDRSGSGRAEIAIRMPEQLKALGQSAASLQAQGRAGPNPLAGTQTFRFSREEAEKSFANRPGIHVVKVDEVKGAGIVGYRIELTFDSLSHLEQALSSRQQNGLSVNGGGRLSLVENGRSFQFHRQIAASKTGPGSRAGSRWPADQTAGKHGCDVLRQPLSDLSVSLHIPDRVSECRKDRPQDQHGGMEVRLGRCDGRRSRHARRADSGPIGLGLRCPGGCRRRRILGDGLEVSRGTPKSGSRPAILEKSRGAPDGAKVPDSGRIRRLEDVAPAGE